jgi:hypothetical protein
VTTTIDEIAPRTYRISTYVPEVAAPHGFTFNQLRALGIIPDRDSVAPQWQRALTIHAHESNHTPCSR